MAAIIILISIAGSWKHHSGYHAIRCQVHTCSRRDDMKRSMIALSLIVIVVTVSLSYGATVIESRDGQGAIHRIWIQGSKMRMGSDSDQSYMFLDAENKKMYVVNPAEKTVMDMSSMLQRKSTPAKQQQSITMQRSGRTGDRRLCYSPLPVLNQW